MSAIANLSLDEPVARFIAETTGTLDQLAHSVGLERPPAMTTDVAVEAFNVAAAFVDADGTHTDDELWALIGAFASRLETDFTGMRPADLRRTDLIKGKRGWIAAVSPLFSLLVDADRKNGTLNSWRYYEDAMHIAHVTCALDTVTTDGELVALDRFRTTLLTAMDRAALGKPWSQVAQPVGGVAAAAAAAPAPAPAELAPARPIEQLLAELDDLIGLAEVKAEVRLVSNLIRVTQLRRQRHLPVAETSHHLVFTGNPGTGKTTVARLIGQIYRTLGVLEKGQLVETERAGLVAGYMGQTAIKTTTVFNSASGGLLLIDEAYALVRGKESDFGQEAIDTLVKLMEDRRDEVVVIAAGYPEEMSEFIDANPGLRSRFPRTIHFPDYTTDDLVAIFEALCEDSSYRLTPEATAALRARLDAEPRGKGFGNGRLARNLFEAAVGCQASRVVAQANPTDDDLCSLVAEDIIGG